MTDSSPLEPVRDDWRRVLAVVAHPDDLEYGAAAAVACWTDRGVPVGYCLVTSGEAGIDGMYPDDARVTREAEQRASAAVVGVDHVEFLGLPDGVLEYGVGLRREIARSVRRFRPDLVVTNNFRESWDPDGVFLNQADHIATGRATLDAVRDAGNRWVFPDQLGDGVDAWRGVQEVWAFGSPRAGHGMDVTGTFDRGVESLRAHAAYLEGLGPDAPEPAEFLGGMARGTGSRLGCRYGVAFEVFRVG